MLMPEAAVHQHRLSPPRQNKVRRAGQIAPMQPKAPAHCVQHSSHAKLGRGVALHDSAHVLASLLGRQTVRHGS
jgi:hypothetical protein